MKRTLHLIAAMTCFALCQTLVQSAVKYWDIDGATGEAGGPTPSGTWATGAGNWSDNDAGTSPSTWADDDDAVFSAGSDATGAFVVTLSGSPVLYSLTVEEGTVTISGGTSLTVGTGAGTFLISIAAGLTTTINSAIAGGASAGQILKLPDGALVLNGANTYAAQTVVQGGMLSYDSIGNAVIGGPGVPSALGAPTTVQSGTIKLGTPGYGTTLKYTGSGHSTDRVIDLASTTGGVTNDASGTGPILFTSLTGITASGNGKKMLTLAGTDTGDNTIAGPIANNSAANFTRVEKQGPGTWVLSGLSTYSGVTDIRDGTLIVNALANKGIASSVGAGDASVGGGWHAVIGLGEAGLTNATLKYIGTGHSSDRKICLWGTTGGGTIDASGTGPLILNGGIIHDPATTETADKLLTLKGSNTGTNTISGSITNGRGAFKTSVKKDGVGEWVLSGANIYTGATTVNQGTLLVDSPGSLSAASVVSVAPGATLGGNGIINGPVTINSGGILSPGASIGTLTLNSNLTLAGDLFIELNKSSSPSNDVINVAGTLTNAGTGTVTVTNLGPALVAGDSFKLFNKPLLNGQALSIVSADSVIWTNKLAVDGSIAVVPATMPQVPATNLTIVATSPTSFSLGGMGAANSAYGVYASTNVTTPMTNWWLIGTTNSNGSGVIQFFDAQATNAQRFYRFGQ
jgi:autotransporter-associated beta strand protein